MLAFEYDQYGPPENLRLRTVDRPRPRRGEVLVRVHGTSASPIDVKVRAGGMRMFSGERFPKRTGLDFAGEVVEVAAGVAGFELGDPVWGFIGGVSGRLGGAAEYLAINPKILSRAPRGIDLVEAAALPNVGVAAMKGLRQLRVGRGDSVLIVGASGGIGTSAIQLAVAAGARVTAVARASSRSLCESIGAKDVIDYATTDLRVLPRRFNAVLDCHGRSLADYRRLVAPGGRILTTSPDGMGFAVGSLLTPGPRARVLMSRPNQSDLLEVARHVERGNLRPIVDRVYALPELPAAQRALESGHSRGKRVVRVLHAA
jgi:NADPH:quinone reductase-like Zn-dependent oxidoreductase